MWCSGSWFGYLRYLTWPWNTGCSAIHFGKRGIQGENVGSSESGPNNLWQLIYKVYHRRFHLNSGAYQSCMLFKWNAYKSIALLLKQPSVVKLFNTAASRQLLAKSFWETFNEWPPSGSFLAYSLYLGYTTNLTECRKWFVCLLSM